MSNDTRKVQHSLLNEHIFFLALGFIALNSYWAYTERISLGILRPAFFQAFFLACILIGLFLFVGRIGNLTGKIFPNSWKRILCEIAAPFAVIAGSAYLVRDFFQGDFPATFDHTTQILRCQLSETALWQHGTLLPWTSSIGAGVPLNDLYPPGGSLLYCLIRALSLFQLDRETAYRYTVFISWLTLLGGLYAAGRLFFGISAGVLAAGLMAITAGSQLQAGWTQAFYIGMWPMTLCCGLALTALILFAYTLFQESRRWLMAFLSLFTAGAILAHPFGFVLLLISTPIILVIALAATDNKTRALQRAGRNLVYTLLGIGLAGWWFFPFIASASWTLPFGAPNQSPQMLSVNLIEGKYLENMSPLLNGIILTGLFWGLASRQAIPTSFAVLGAFFLLLDQNTWKYWFFSKSQALFIMNVPLSRFSGLGKILGFVLAGGMAQNSLANLLPILGSLRRILYAGFEDQDSSSSIHGIAQVMGRSLATTLIVSAILPIVVPALNYYYKTYTKPVTVELAGYPSQPPYARDFDSAIRYVQSIDPPSGEDSFFRPLTGMKIGIHTSLVESTIPYRFGYGIVAPSYMPTMLLTTRSSRNDDTAPSLSGMKYIFAIGRIANMFSKEPGALFLNQFGEITVFKQERYSETPAQIVNAPGGRATIEANEPNRLALRLEGIQGEAWTRVGVSRYRKWRAFENGREIPIVERIERGEPLDAGKYISVKAQNGLLELRYAPQTMDWMAYSLTILCVLGLAIPFSNRRFFQFASFETTCTTRCLEYAQTRQFRTILYGTTCGLLVLIALMFRLQHANRNTQFWYAGILCDVVSPKSVKPDNALDLGFGLAIGMDHAGKTLKSASLREIYPEPLQSPHQWTTEEGSLWKLALAPIGDDINPGFEIDTPLPIRLKPSQSIDMYAANPHRGDYIPTGTMAELTLYFEGGETASYRCPILKQGTH